MALTFRIRKLYVFKSHALSRVRASTTFSRFILQQMLSRASVHQLPAFSGLKVEQRSSYCIQSNPISNSQAATTTTTTAALSPALQNIILVHNANSPQAPPAARELLLCAFAYVQFFQLAEPQAAGQRAKWRWRSVNGAQVELRVEIHNVCYYCLARSLAC
jgi:hypothetical protein